MKKVLSVVVILLLISPVFSFDLITVGYSFEVGWMDKASVSYEIDPVEGYPEIKNYEDWDNEFIDLGIRFWFFKYLYVGGSTLTMMHSGTGRWTFDPTWMIYDFDAGIKYGNMELFYNHRCIHPVMAYSAMYDVTTVNNEGGFNRIGLRYSKDFHSLGK